MSEKSFELWDDVQILTEPPVPGKIVDIYPAESLPYQVQFKDAITDEDDPYYGEHREAYGAEELRHLNPETRVVDPVTGGAKGKKPEELGFIDPLSLEYLARVASYGAAKYEDPFNYLKGYSWSLSYNAMHRHARAHWAGELIDPESGLPHMAHAAWHALAQVSFQLRGVGTDDRPPK